MVNKFGCGQVQEIAYKKVIHRALLWTQGLVYKALDSIHQLGDPIGVEKIKIDLTIIRTKFHILPPTE